MTLHHFVSVIRRQAAVVLTVVAIGLAFMYVFRNAVPSSFAGVSHVVLVADSGARDPSVSIVDLPSIATSTVVLQRVRESLKLPISLIDLKANVSASVLGRSTIMAVGFRDQSAERAINVANAVAVELSHYYDEISTQRYDVNVSRLSLELNAEASKLRDLDKQISHVVATNPFVVSDRSIDNITTEMATLDEDRATAGGQLASDQALAGTMTGGPDLSRTARHEILSNDPAYVAERTAAAKDDAQLAVDRASYTNSFPGLPGELAKLRGESDSIRAEAARALSDPNAFSPSAASMQQQRARQTAIVSGDAARVAQLDGLIATEQQRLDAVPTVGSQFSELAAQRAAIQTEYTELATRRANALADRAEASSLGSVVVLDRAIKADTQLAGGRTRAAGAALMFVLALALGSAFLVESLDPRIKRQQDVEELYGIPVVATFGAKA